MLAHLVRNHAQQMERVGMIRLGRENLPIDLLGSLQPTALMVLDCNRQCFRNCCHGGYYGEKTCGLQLCQERA